MLSKLKTYGDLRKHLPYCNQHSIKQNTILSQDLLEIHHFYCFRKAFIRDFSPVHGRWTQFIYLQVKIIEQQIPQSACSDTTKATCMRRHFLTFFPHISSTCLGEDSRCTIQLVVTPTPICPAHKHLCCILPSAGANNTCAGDTFCWKAVWHALKQPQESQTFIG